MDEKKLEEALNSIKEESKASKFKPSIDLIISLKKASPKETIQIDSLISLPNPTKTSKVCAFVDKGLYPTAKTIFDNTIQKDDFAKYDKKSIRKLSKEYDFFVGEAAIMPQLAAKFGKQLTGVGKMPNPKTETIINPNTKLDEMYKKLKQSIRLTNKKNLAVQLKVGEIDWDNKKLIENVKYIYDLIIRLLPSGEKNIRNAYVKATMGKPISI